MSQPKFVVVLFRAFIFAVIFFTMGIGISFVFEKILDWEGFANQDVSINVDQEKEPEKHLVDITIKDEELPLEENAPQFFVGTNHRLLKPEDTLNNSSAKKNDIMPVKEDDNAKKTIENSEVKDPKPEKNPISNEKKENSFVPVSIVSAGNQSAQTSQTVSEEKKDDLPAENNAANEAVVDILPDLEDITGSISAPLSSSNETITAEQQDFSSRKMPMKTVAKNSPTEKKDAALMAKAISTLLAADN